MLVTVTGTVLGVPATNGVTGCPIDVIKLDAGAAATGVVGDIGIAALFVALAAGSFGEPVVAVVVGVGVTPTVLGAAVTGKLSTTALLGAV
jgi:hypothetical protein